ncbi:MAG: Tat pathway signal protein, partial [Haloplanus sp.]
MPFDGDIDRSRRAVLKAAVAVGGASALSACLDRTEDEPVPAGDPNDKPTEQHAWREYVRRDEYGNSQLPSHQILLYLTLDADGVPSADDRDALAATLDALDRAYAWSHEGLLHSIAYSPAYVDRFEESLPDGIDLPEPRALSPFESPTFDRQDAVLHLASDRADALLEADRALRGERAEANGVTVLSVDSRRTGFVGAGLPAQHQDVAGIPDSKPVPEASPLFMGFEAGFRGNQATEAYVTIDDGPFAGGTTKVIANLRQRLADWYGEQSHEERVMEMFSPGHAAEGLVEGAGDNLGSKSGIDRFVDDIESDAQEYGRVGHAQKAARANRDADGNVRLLRR